MLWVVCANVAPPGGALIFSIDKEDLCFPGAVQNLLLSLPDRKVNQIARYQHLLCAAQLINSRQDVSPSLIPTTIGFYVQGIVVASLRAFCWHHVEQTGSFLGLFSCVWTCHVFLASSTMYCTLLHCTVYYFRKAPPHPASRNRLPYAAPRPLREQG